MRVIPELVHCKNNTNILTLGTKKRSALNLYNQSSRKWKRRDSISSPFRKEKKVYRVKFQSSGSRMIDTGVEKVDLNHLCSHPVIPRQEYLAVPLSLCLSCSRTCPWHTAQRLPPESLPRREFLEESRRYQSDDYCTAWQHEIWQKQFGKVFFCKWRHSLYICCMIEVCENKTQGTRHYVVGIMSRGMLLEQLGSIQCCKNTLKSH